MGNSVILIFASLLNWCQFLGNNVHLKEQILFFKRRSPFVMVLSSRVAAGPGSTVGGAPDL